MGNEQTRPPDTMGGEQLPIPQKFDLQNHDKKWNWNYFEKINMKDIYYLICLEYSEVNEVHFEYDHKIGLLTQQLQRSGCHFSLVSLQGQQSNL